MSIIGIPNRPLGTDPRSIADITANFDAILADYNGSIDLSNLATAVKNAFLKLGVVEDRKTYFRRNLDPGLGFNNAAGRSRVAWNYAHGLGVNPYFVLPTMRPVAIQEDANTRAPAISVVSHDTVNISLVATVDGTSNNGAQYDLLIVV
jgi:hypothetical protein